MRKLFWVFIVCLVICSVASAKMKNEPEEVQGLKFNTDIADIPGLLQKDGYYVKENENLTVFDVPVNEIRYRFYKNRLYEISYFFDGLYNYNHINEKLFNQHGLSAGAEVTTTGFWIGDTTVLPPGREVWYGKDVYILLEYNSGKGILQYQYLPILREMYK